MSRKGVRWDWLTVFVAVVLMLFAINWCLGITLQVIQLKNQTIASQGAWIEELEKQLKEQRPIALGNGVTITRR